MQPEAEVKIHKQNCRHNSNCICDKISRVCEVKNLGNYINYWMSWDEHVI